MLTDKDKEQLIREDLKEDVKLENQHKQYIENAQNWTDTIWVVKTVLDTEKPEDEAGDGYKRVGEPFEVKTDDKDDCGYILLPDGRVFGLDASYEDKEGHTYDCYCALDILPCKITEMYTAKDYLF